MDQLRWNACSRVGVNVVPPSQQIMANQPDMQRIFATRIVQLGANLEPGHYYLLVEITDKTTKDKEPPIAQWIDFEIVK